MAELRELKKSDRNLVFRSGNSSLSVTIPEITGGNYGLHVWPCAPVLAQYLWYHRSRLHGKRLLELGAGTALPGVVAAKCGADVILSDSSVLPSCLEICSLSSAANGLELPVIGIKWGTFDSIIKLPPLDFVIASDCFYEPDVFEDIIMTVSLLLERNPEACFICTYQEREPDWTFQPELVKWQLSCTSVPLESFDADHENVAQSGLPGSHKIHLFQIRKKCQGEAQ
ncbi:probable methyltransferase-like protein 23 [Hyalella azteca]|uniref:Probable methyltransferase-like protein 23 n=1 Tax=Hyalella azteca TaxID=294128 RepID=A0A8B7NQE7_HYAAZ|nr:probable methyltransferase-like protein 23 [Hyalella azteca]